MLECSSWRRGEVGPSCAPSLPPAGNDTTMILQITPPSTNTPLRSSSIEIFLNVCLRLFDVTLTLRS